MLFDLRGSGRRRVVKIVYVTLAILMGGGLVLFGIGGSGALSGGLLDAITESSGGATTAPTVSATLEQEAVAKARQDPTRCDLGRRGPCALQPGADGRVVDQNTGNLHGRRRRAAALRRPGLGRERASSPSGTPDPRVASLMVQAYAGIGELDKAAGAQEVIAEDRNSAGAYATLAQIAYQAGQTRKGDLARAKALELTEPDMREALKGQLDQAKQGLAAAVAPGRHAERAAVLRDADSESRIGSDRALQSLAHALVAQLAEQRNS